MQHSYITTRASYLTESKKPLLLRLHSWVLQELWLCSGIQIEKISSPMFYTGLFSLLVIALKRVEKRAAFICMKMVYEVLYSRLKMVPFLSREVMSCCLNLNQASGHMHLKYFDMLLKPEAALFCVRASPSEIS